jgi:hypothetical protein
MNELIKKVILLLLIMVLSSFLIIIIIYVSLIIISIFLNVGVKVMSVNDGELEFMIFV